MFLLHTIGAIELRQPIVEAGRVCNPHCRLGSRKVGIRLIQDPQGQRSPSPSPLSSFLKDVINLDLILVVSAFVLSVL